MEEHEIHEAIGQMIVSCQSMMEEYKAGSAEYSTVCARGVLYDLGYSHDQALDVLRHISDGGFNYCLDAEIPMTGHHDARGETPHPHVCYWGADQLESRLQCLTNLPYNYRRR